MMRRKARAALPAAFLAWILSLGGADALAAQEGPYSIRGAVDWPAGRIEATVSADALAMDLNPPSGRARGEAILDWEFPELMRGSLLGLLVDSRTSLGDALASGAYPAEAFAAIIGSAPQERARFSDDMSAFSADYGLSLQDLAAPLIKHRRAAAPIALLGYVPTRPFSGILIYAKGELPVRGERGKAVLRPCLFPRVWTDRMDVVIERGMAEPESIRRWGLIGYAEDDGAESLEARTGDDPLRIMAVAVFGSNKTDVVISREDALRILSEKANRALIAEGRVAIVIDGALAPIGE